jgi:DNA-binding response OmpR family regulator
MPPTPRLVLIDAFPEETEMYAAIFGHRGYEVVVVPLDDVRAGEIGRIDPQAVLLRMPPCPGIADVLARLKQDPVTDGCPLIVLTTVTDRDAIAAVRLAGATSVLLLPCQPDDVLDVIDVDLRRRSRARDRISSGTHG